MKKSLTVAALLATAIHAGAAVSITDSRTVYTQDFDTLASSGTTGSVLPADWVFSEAGTNANTTYGVGTGSSNTGNTYSFGAAGSTERALGGLQSSPLTPSFGASFRNDATRTITAVNIQYVGEQWRLGTVTRTDALNFEYSLDATSLSTGTWTAVTSLNFVAPNQGPTTGALNGNSNANQAALSGSFNTSLASGATFWIRWTDFNAIGADDGLAIDNFQLTVTLAPVPEPATQALLLAGLGAVGLLARRRGTRA
ncbi:PEP-CTERM sorting domain-containing protein [Ideonella sp. DXS22W]|uniref:PEP-CTERM sorting domain-containing protein n=1 Tax=Pseudaquabacterium inlustre TaxID=2984192 RepID=A0ABU9CS51_9BURK